MRGFEPEITLEDVESIAVLHSDTFHIASREMRERLRSGDVVKIHFRHVESGHVERMWVEMREVTAEGYRGVLDSDPTKPIGIEAGDPVAFLPHHISHFWLEPDHDWDERIHLPPHRFRSPERIDG